MREKNIFYIIVFLLISACSGNNSPSHLRTLTIASGLPEIDSLIQVEWLSGKRNRGIVLFNIAAGGDLEYLSDTIVNMSGKQYVIIEIADYFQESQLFYIVYDIQQNRLKQSQRIYLPNWGISKFSELQFAGLSKDSLFLKIKNKEWKSALLDTIIYNKQKIINFYELE